MDLTNSNSTINYSLLASVSIFASILVVIFIFGILLSVFSVIVIIKSKIKNANNILILNLLVADIVYMIGLPFLVSNELNQYWISGLLGCRIFFLTDFVGMLVGVSKS
jgi:somatostatin receptor 5